MINFLKPKNILKARDIYTRHFIEEKEIPF